MITIIVKGIPAPKGSYRPVCNRRTGHILLLPQSKREPQWRKAVKESIITQNLPPIPADHRISVQIDFFIPRPKSVPPRKRFRPTVPPDIDKLLRSSLDGMTDSGLIRDDALIVDVSGRKFYADHGFTGCIIRLTSAPNVMTRHAEVA